MRWAESPCTNATKRDSLPIDYNWLPQASQGFGSSMIQTSLRQKLQNNSPQDNCSQSSYTFLEKTHLPASNSAHTCFMIDGQTKLTTFLLSFGAARIIQIRSTWESSTPTHVSILFPRTMQKPPVFILGQMNSTALLYLHVKLCQQIKWNFTKIAWAKPRKVRFRWKYKNMISAAKPQTSRALEPKVPIPECCLLDVSIFAEQRATAHQS